MRTTSILLTISTALQVQAFTTITTSHTSRTICGNSHRITAEVSSFGLRVATSDLSSMDGNFASTPTLPIPTGASLSSQNSMIVVDTIMQEVPKQPTKASPTAINTNVQTWKRRLDTHEDPFNVHKWAGLGWILSSTIIFGCGTSSGYTDVPSFLEPVSYLFLLSTIVQSMSSIPMALKHRAHEPEIQRGFIASAISSVNLAFTGFWLGPFGDKAQSYFATHLNHVPDIGMLFVALALLGDSLWGLVSLTDMNARLTEINELDPIKDAKSIPDKITEAIVAFPIGMFLNIFMLQQLYVHAGNARSDFLDIIVSHGSSSELVFYASMVSSIGIGVGNLAVTLHHRKLISADMNNFATLGSVVATVVFNLRAAGDMFA